MVTNLEDRLRRELLAESQEIAAGNLPGLRLPGPQVGRATGRRGPRRRRGNGGRWLAWVVPLAAAAAVVAVVLVVRGVSGALPGRPPAASVAASARFGVPPYYAYGVGRYTYVQGPTHFTVGGRYAQIRSTATGQVLATIDPPAPCTNFKLITADASGRVFVLGAERFWASVAPRTLGRHVVTPMKFLLVRVGSDGQVGVSGLSLPVGLTPKEQPSIALSPNGARLAIAYGGAGQDAVVQVVDLATGQSRRWVALHPAWSPVIGATGAWTADGRTLAVQEQRWRYFSVNSSHPFRAIAQVSVKSVLLFDTVGPGGAMPSRTVVLHAPAGYLGPGDPFLAPGGMAMVAPVYRILRKGGWIRGMGKELAVYSAATGALLRTAVPSTHRLGSNVAGANSVAWSNASGTRLVILRAARNREVLGVLTGNSFTTVSPLLPRLGPAYRALESALQQSPSAW